MIFDVDVSKWMPPEINAQLSEDMARTLLRDIADMARAKWIALANEKLQKTSQDYVRGISRVRLLNDVATITLLGRWPNQLEAGFPPYDMRTTLLGPGVPVVPRGERGKHQSKNGGFYRSIAFRHMTPSASGRNGQRVTDAYARQLGTERARELGKQAYREMKKLTPSLSNPGEKTAYGGRLKTAGTALEIRGRSHALERTADGSMRLVRGGGREHAAPLFEGMVKNQQTYARATQSFYGTFRTISTNSPDGWIHPGYDGAHLVDEVVAFINRVGPDMVAIAIDQLGSPHV